MCPFVGADCCPGIGGLCPGGICDSCCGDGKLDGGTVAGIPKFCCGPCCCCGGKPCCGCCEFGIEPCDIDGN